MISVPRIEKPTVKPTRLIPITICRSVARLVSAFVSDLSAPLRPKVVLVPIALDFAGRAGWRCRCPAMLYKRILGPEFQNLTKRVKIFPYPEGCTRKGGSRDESKRRAFAWRRGYSLHTAQNITKPFSHASWTKPSSGEHNSRKHDGKWHRSNEKPEHRVVSLSSADGAEKQEGQSEGKGAHVVLAVIGPFQGRRIPSRLVRKSA